jgi:tyrosine-specific transport protein
MNTKLLGSILLIVGTTIGGGMLALPIATSQAGFVNSSLLLFGCWLVMTASAFLILEINLWLPEHSNMISMVKATLGKSAEVVAWVTYLLLFYSLLAAYIAGGGDFLKNLAALTHVNVPGWLASLLFASVLGYVVCLGIRSVDIVNRSLMFVKLGTFVLLVAFIMPHVSTTYFQEGEFHYLTASITVALTSFGFATIVPNLRSYFQNDIKKLHLAILIGSFIPLVCYILWDAAIMGVIPAEGEDGLIAMLHSNRSTSDFVNSLSALLNRDTVTAFARIFTSICLATSFLGVALGLSHFLADGLGLARVKSIKNDIIVFGATFVPPIIIVIFYPGIFISALGYAGIYCTILLILLPSLMAWSGRYRKKIARGYQVRGGKLLLILLFITSILILLNSFYDLLK